MQGSKASQLALTTLAVFALAACSESSGGGAESGAGAEAQATASAGAEDATQSIPMTETGWLSVGRDGSVQTTFFDAAGRYRDFRNGELWGEGQWEQRPDGSICFEPDTGTGACWETGAPDEDGSIIVTDEENRRVEIKRVTYIAPETDQNTTQDAG